MIITRLRLPSLAVICCALAPLFSACSNDATSTGETIVVLWWEGVPEQVAADAEQGNASVLPTLASLKGLRWHGAYYPSSNLSETRLASLLIEDGRFPSPAGPLDWGARRVPEGALASELRAAGYQRIASVSRAQLACLETQFDIFAAPPSNAAESAMQHDFALRALDPTLDKAFASNDNLFVLIATDVLARRDLPPAVDLAPHLRARLAPHVATRPEVVEMMQRLASEPAVAAEALREKLGRRRGDALWEALQTAEADARLSRVDRWLGDMLQRLERHGRLENLRLIVAGGTARDPWDVALGTNDEGRALLATLGMPLFYGPIQEIDLRTALRRGLSQPTDSADGPAASRERHPDPFVSRVTTRAGELSMVLRCRIEATDGAREENWISDADGDRPAPGSSSELHVEEFMRRVGADWQRHSLRVANAGDESARLELFMPEGEVASVDGLAQRRCAISLPGTSEVNVRTTRRRQDCLVTWTGTSVDLSTCSIGARRLADSDLPVVPEASTFAWDESQSEPRFAITGAGAWMNLRIGHAGDGEVEFGVEAWPPRLEPGDDWIDVSGDAHVVSHPLRPAARIVRGTAPLAIRLMRSANGRFGYCARIGGERIGLAHTRIDGQQAVAQGSVTILLSSGAWNDATLYGAAPQDSQHALELLGSPPRDPVTLPSAAERSLLLRAARIR